MKDLLKSIFQEQSVGKQQSMREYVNDLTTVNFGGTFVMKNDNNNNNFTEGQVLIMTMVMLVGITIILNGCAEIFIRVL